MAGSSGNYPYFWNSANNLKKWGSGIPGAYAEIPSGYYPHECAIGLHVPVEFDNAKVFPFQANLPDELTFPPLQI